MLYSKHCFQFNCLYISIRIRTFLSHICKVLLKRFNNLLTSNITKYASSWELEAPIQGNWIFLRTSQIHSEVRQWFTRVRTGAGAERSEGDGDLHGSGPGQEQNGQRDTVIYTGQDRGRSRTVRGTQWFTRVRTGAGAERSEGHSDLHGSGPGQEQNGQRDTVIYTGQDRGRSRTVRGTQWFTQCRTGAGAERSEGHSDLHGSGPGLEPNDQRDAVTLNSSEISDTKEEICFMRRSTLLSLPVFSRVVMARVAMLRLESVIRFSRSKLQAVTAEGCFIATWQTWSALHKLRKPATSTRRQRSHIHIQMFWWELEKVFYVLPKSTD